MIGVPAMLPPQSLAARLLRCSITKLGPLLSLRIREDSSGWYTYLPSRGLHVRAKAQHEPWSARWIESEAAKLIYRALINDKAGERSLIKLADIDPWFQEEEVLRRAKRLIPLRLEELAVD